MPEDVLNFYCDCSSYTGDNAFAVVGGVAVKSHVEAEIAERINELRAPVGMESEFKWSAYRAGRKRAAYEGLIDLMFECLQQDHLHFHSLIVNFDQFDHHRGGRGSRQRSVNKMYFQLMLHEICRRYGQRWRIVMYPDHGADSQEIGNYRGAICAQARQRYRTQLNCLRAIHPTNSRKSPLLQMTDVAIGAIAAQRESRLLSEGKASLRQYFCERSPVPDFANDTPRSERRFSVWNFRLS